MNNYNDCCWNNDNCCYLPPEEPTYNQECNTTNSCYIQECPHITTFHTHNVRNIIRRHYNVPMYSYSESYQVFDEYPNNAYIMQTNNFVGNNNQFGTMNGFTNPYGNEVNVDPNMYNPYTYNNFNTGPTEQNIYANGMPYNMNFRG